MLAVIETHPIQYHAPVYRALQARFGVPVTAIYGSDFSARTYRDREFGAAFAWDADLLSGYAHRVLVHAEDGAEPDLTRLSARGVDAALRDVQPDATLIVGYSPAFHRQAWRAACRLGRPVLFRGETSDLRQSPDRLRGFARDAGLRLAYRSCARLLYIGERSRAHYRRLGVSEARLVFAPYCVDTTPFRGGEDARRTERAGARARLALDADDVVLMFSGKLSHRKGVDLLPAAVRALPADLQRRIVLLFVGDGALRAAVETDAAAAPIVRTRFVGFQQQQMLSGFYHAADLLVLPSRIGETWGLVVNEALHHGVPVVVSDQVGCAPDLVDASTGRIARADDVSALARAVADAASLVGRPDVRARCRARVEAYSVEAAARGIATAYAAATGRALAA